MPEAFHSATDDLPFADDWANTPGVRLKLLMADIEGARFAVRIRFAPGILLPPHKHTGEVHAFTLAGEWSYIEHPGIPPSRAGSYLFEPPGSTHTLKVADHLREETDVVFVVYGAMIHLGPKGEVLAIGDAKAIFAIGRPPSERKASACRTRFRSAARCAIGRSDDARPCARRRRRSARRSPTRREKRESGFRRTARGRGISAPAG
jgi:2,4'-dihydroxyacetophenone dioxygenase